jgi:hypothetical protein
VTLPDSDSEDYDINTTPETELYSQSKYEEGAPTSDEIASFDKDTSKNSGNNKDQDRLVILPPSVSVTPSENKKPPKRRRKVNYTNEEQPFDFYKPPPIVETQPLYTQKPQPTEELQTATAASKIVVDIPPSSAPPILFEEEDLSPDEADHRLKELGVTDPKVTTGVIKLQNGTTLLVTRRESVKLRPLSEACINMLRSSEFYQSISAATSSVRSLMHDRNSESLQRVRSSLATVSKLELAGCDPKTSLSLDGTLMALDSWSASQTQVASAQKELEEALRRVAMAKLALKEANTQASTAESENSENISKLLPSLYAGLKRWERVEGGGGGDISSSSIS